MLVVSGGMDPGQGGAGVRPYPQLVPPAGLSGSSGSSRTVIDILSRLAAYRSGTRGPCRAMSGHVGSCRATGMG